MKTKKMSLSNIQDVLSRDEMKQIMAGSVGGGGTYDCICDRGYPHWIKYYASWGDIGDDISNNCGGGGGVCTLLS